MKKPPNHWLFFSGLAFQVAGVMYVAVLGGQKIDGLMDNAKSYGTMSMVILGVLVILYLIVKQTKHLR